MLSFRLKWGWKQLPLKLSKLGQSNLLRIILENSPGTLSTLSPSNLRCVMQRACLISSVQLSPWYRIVVSQWLNNTSQASGILTDWSIIIISQVFPIPQILIMRQNDLPASASAILALLGLQMLASRTALSILPKTLPLNTSFSVKKGSGQYADRMV